MRSGSYIQALGRQSFEPSQPAPASPDNRPLPSEQSHERQRHLMKAQNDVLATVGVCLRDTKQSIGVTESLAAENEAGLALGVLDLTVTYLASWPLIGLRNRLQTYRTYEGLRYRDVLKLEWRRNSWATLFSGMPAHLCFQVVNLTREYFQGSFMNWLQKKPLFRDSKSGERRTFWLHVVDKSLTFASWFIVYPIWYHSNLQALHILPPWPLLPSPASLVAFGPASPISLLTFTAPLLPQLLNSYFLHSFLNQLVSATLQYQLYNIILEHLPAPPDAIMPDHSSETEMMSIEIDLDTEADSNDERLRGGTATLPFNPLTGAIIPSPQPIDIDPLELEADSSSETESHPVRTSTPPAPPTRPQSPPFRAEPSSSGPLPLRRATSLADAPTHPVHAHRQEYRRTTLAGHPADIAASHISDCATNAVLLIWESAMLRTLARPRAWRRAVYAPFEILGPGQELLTKAVVVGEWGMLWLLFEGSVVTSTWMGVRWFGYARGL